MVSVTQRIKQVKQPRGGYIKPSEMRTRRLDDGHETAMDHKIENIHPILVGISVDYLVRLSNGSAPHDAFAISLAGARAIGFDAFSDAFDAVENLDAGRVDEETVISACRLAGYDVAYRAGVEFYNPDSQTTPDAVTVKHILTMVERSRTFFREYGPIVSNGFAFDKPFGLITSGDGDFLTKDTLWDFKVSVNPPTKDHTLQLLIYLILGLASERPEFEQISSLGIFNPRRNIVHQIALVDIPEAVMEEVVYGVMLGIRP